MLEAAVKNALFLVNKQALYESFKSDLNGAYRATRRAIYLKYHSADCIKSTTLAVDSKLPAGYYRAPADLISWIYPQPTDTQEAVTSETGTEKIYALPSSEVTYIYESEIMPTVYEKAIAAQFVVDYSVRLGVAAADLNVLVLQLQKNLDELNRYVKHVTRAQNPNQSCGGRACLL
jgi:hypothetical protein